MSTGIPSGRSFAGFDAFGIYTRLTARGARTRQTGAPAPPPRPGLGSQRDLPVDPGGLAPSIALRHLPHADQRVGPAPQHQLLQVPDPGPVLLLRRLEDPLPQPPYLLLLLPPDDLVPAGCVSWGPVLRSVHHRGRRDLGEAGRPRCRRPIPGWRSCSPSSRLTCPSVPAGLTASLQRLTCPRQHPFGSGQQARYPASYAGRPAEEPAMLPRFPVAFRRTGIRFLGILFPPGIPPSLPPAYRQPVAPDPDGVSTFRMRETATGVGAPSTPGPAVFTRPAKICPAAACRSSSGQALHPGVHPICRGSG